MDLVYSSTGFGFVGSSFSSMLRSPLWGSTDMIMLKPLDGTASNAVDPLVTPLRFQSSSRRKIERKSSELTEASFEALHRNWDLETALALQKIIDMPVPNGRKKVAAFDADGTIWTNDVAEIFMKWMEEHDYWPRPGNYCERYDQMIAEGKISEAYGYAAQLFAGMPISEIRQRTKECFEEHTIQCIRPEMQQLLQLLHERKDWEVYIVSASPKWVVDAGAFHMGLSPENVIGIEVEEKNGMGTDQLKLPIPLREGKAVVLQKILDGRSASLCAGNSLDDEALLQTSSGVSIVVTPESVPTEENRRACRELTQMAAEHGWMVHRPCHVVEENAIYA
eukprot:CAMPEP_0113934292 /NCGR_PEP_ID=MMETSP1339-20121228/1632_1 /TAXON_ID=94617 /ORGANISM="Fibrocapsa japonica" /LENGTH=335 /DNA_ID=CAMNT_0000936025 /DNA_START=74 /DNA_END=1081 /DNA_ORIENTATION=- /assembly_acc=CAM_ASM_000762